MLYKSLNEQDTKNIAKALAQSAAPGTIYCLNGELGAGKTQFAKGFAQGLDITNDILSPTFTILNIYKGRLDLYHFDVYRINQAEEMYDLGYEDYFFAEGVCLIEWSENIKELLPGNCIYINISKDLEKGEDYRLIEVTNESTGN